MKFLMYLCLVLGIINLAFVPVMIIIGNFTQVFMNLGIGIFCLYVYNVNKKIGN